MLERLEMLCCEEQWLAATIEKSFIAVLSKERLTERFIFVKTQKIPFDDNMRIKKILVRYASYMGR